MIILLIALMLNQSIMLEWVQKFIGYKLILIKSMIESARSKSNSKSFKALSMAQPIRKDIETTLIKLEQQKRKFLANERQETLLKQQSAAKLKKRNDLYSQAPQTVTDEKRTSQTYLKFRNTDRTYEITINNIQKLKNAINLHRKQMDKYKLINNNLTQDSDRLNKQIEKLLEDIATKQQQNQSMKQQIINFRELNIRNLNQFQKSHINLNKSNTRDENQRRKNAIGTKTFLGEELRQSKIVHFQLISDQLKKSGIQTNQGRVDIMTESVPIAKARVNYIIHKNKEKIKIAEDYKKFGEGLDDMFNIMKKYKGRDDVDYLAEEFVGKQNQIQKLGEYIGKLEYMIVQSKRKVDHKINNDKKLQEQLQIQTETESQKQYKALNQHVRSQIDELNSERQKMNEWLEKVGEIICPLSDDSDFSRNNAVNAIGKIEQALKINNSSPKRSKSPNKIQPVINIDQQEHFQKHGQLMGYQKLKEYANDFIKAKK